MSYEIRPDYSVSYLLPPAVEDWVPANHPARFIREFVDNLDLQDLGFCTRTGKIGAPSYSANLLVKVWLYGWFEKQRSFRQLEKACRQHMALIWLTGQNYPDHNTLWRFWKDNQKPLRQLFRKSVEIAWEIDLVGLALHAVDGTKITICSRRGGALHRADLEKLLQKADEQIEAMALELEIGNGECNSPGSELPEQMANAQSLRQRVRKALDQLDKAGLQRLQPNEPQARMMQTPVRREWSYNAQAVADEQSNLVLAADLTNSESDSAQLVPMIDQVKNTLGCVAECTVADGGYASAQQLHQAEQRGYDVAVNIPDPGETNPFHRSHFHYDAKLDQWVCPQGQRLRFMGEVTKEGIVQRHYTGAPCTSCSVRALCTKLKQRTLDVSLHHETLDRHRKKRKQMGYADALYRRKTIIEPRFGWIKQIQGMRRWTVRGLEKAKTQWLTICTIWNLKRMWEMLWGKSTTQTNRIPLHNETLAQIQLMRA